MTFSPRKRQSRAGGPCSGSEGSRQIQSRFLRLVLSHSRQVFSGVERSKVRDIACESTDSDAMGDPRLAIRFRVVANSRLCYPSSTMSKRPEEAMADMLANLKKTTGKALEEWQ